MEFAWERYERSLCKRPEWHALSEHEKDWVIQGLIAQGTDLLAEREVHLKDAPNVWFRRRTIEESSELLDRLRFESADEKLLGYAR